jgi:hypothetical protein
MFVVSFKLSFFPSFDSTFVSLPVYSFTSFLLYFRFHLCLCIFLPLLLHSPFCSTHLSFINCMNGSSSWSLSRSDTSLLHNFKAERKLYVPHVLTPTNYAFCICESCVILTANSDYFLNNIRVSILVMVKSCVFFAVRTEFLNIT